MTAAALPISDRPDRDWRLGLSVAGLFFIGFLLFAAIVPLDSAGFARGVLAKSGGRQLVQHRDGGTVAAIRVKEGDRVRQGDVLIELAGGETLAQERALGAELLMLKAQRARLDAEQSGAGAIMWPADWGVPDAAPAAISDAVARQQSAFRTRRSLLASQVGILGEQARQAAQSSTGYSSRVASAAEQERLVSEEIEGLREVAEKGFVSKTRIRNLERQRAELQGSRGQFEAGAAQSRTEAGASRLRQLELTKQFRERAAAELREVELQLAELEPKYRAAHEQAQKLKVRAPASGTVLALAATTVGGVIGAGETVMEIVPDEPNLVVEARVPLDDAHDMRVGQAAQIRFVTLHDRNLPIINGRVTRVSADSLADEKTGLVFYTAQVVAPPSELAKLAEGSAQELRAGTPVDVLVPRAQRSLLDYLFEPLGNTLWRSMRER